MTINKTPVISDSDFIISEVAVTQLTPNFFTESLNFIGNAKSRGLHRLQVEFKVTLINELDIRKFNALMLKLRGRLNPFELSLHDATDGKSYCNPLYFDAAPLLANSLSIGNNTLILNGVRNSIPAGSMFQFPNDTKVYTLLDDAINNKTVEFFPATRQVHQPTERLNFIVKPLLRLTTDEFKLTYKNATEYSFTAVEVI